MNPRATRSALMVASVPELTRRTISMEGTHSRISSASSTSRSVGAPKLVPISSTSRKRVDHRRKTVAQDQRPPGTDVVDVFVAIDIEDVRSFAARDERRRAADAAKGADGGIDAAGNQLLGAGEQFFRSRVVHGAAQALGFFGDHSLQEDVHQHFLQRAVQIAEQPALQTKIRLRAGEQILDQDAESRAAADEIHHARGNRAEQEPSQENALGERGAELQVGREIATQQSCDRPAPVRPGSATRSAPLRSPDRPIASRSTSLRR